MPEEKKIILITFGNPTLLTCLNIFLQIKKDVSPEKLISNVQDGYLLFLSKVIILK